MFQEKAYLIIDIGTGNVRVAIVSPANKLLHLERDIVHYSKDDLYPDALSFNPDQLWNQILAMTRKALQQVPTLSIVAITASSQREGVVLIDAAGNSIIGLSNHDHRGREWEDMVENKHRVYTLTGRYPTSLFSALKLVGIQKRRPEIYSRMSKVLSISDWAQFKLSAVPGYEHSQASETCLYDVAKKAWSMELTGIFGIDPAILPALHSSGTVLGRVLPEYTAGLGIPTEALVVVGGADTQLAIKSTRPSVNDIVIVSGTTTPIVKIVNEYVTDAGERTWTNRHIDADNFILETNAGVTGLNYQRLKQIFYPNEPYEVIEQELAHNPASLCVASLGSLLAEEKAPSTRGGFIFNTPVSHQLTRSSFVRATLWDIASCIKENLDLLCNVSGHSPDTAWACGGGFQSNLLRQLIANLTGKKLLIRDGYQDASLLGAALVCSEALQLDADPADSIQEVLPNTEPHQDFLFKEWKDVRNSFKETILEEML